MPPPPAYSALALRAGHVVGGRRLLQTCWIAAVPIGQPQRVATELGLKRSKRSSHSGRHPSTGNPANLISQQPVDTRAERLRVACFSPTTLNFIRYENGTSWAFSSALLSRSADLARCIGHGDPRRSLGSSGRPARPLADARCGG